MANPMMYRVFLQDEKDTPDSIENPENHYRVRRLEMNTWCYSEPRRKVTLEEQIKSSNIGKRIGPSPKQMDGHWLIQNNGVTIGVVDDIKDLPEKTYEKALEEAQELTKYISEKEDNNYIFIDVTSRGNKELAKKLSKIIHHQEVFYVPPRAVIIGD